MQVIYLINLKSTRLAALALLGIFLTQTLGPRLSTADTSGDSIPLEEVSFTFSKITYRYGQTLRINLTNVQAGTTGETGQPLLPIRAAAQVKDTEGNTIYISTQNGGVWKTVESAKSLTFEVNRDELPVPGDARTGALAVVPELLIEYPAGARPDFPISLEVTDNQTGAIVFVGGWGCSGYQGSFTDGHSYAAFGSLCSVTGGQTLEVSLTNPLPVVLANQPVSAIDYAIEIKTADGDTSEVRRGRVGPGQTIVARFNRDRLRDAGDAATGRLSLRTQVSYSLQLSPEQAAAIGDLQLFPISREIAAGTGGTTTAHVDSYCGRGIYKSTDSGRTW
jgi:hypothetical protein